MPGPGEGARLPCRLESCILRNLTQGWERKGGKSIVVERRMTEGMHENGQKGRKHGKGRGRRRKGAGRRGRETTLKVKVLPATRQH